METVAQADGQQDPSARDRQQKTGVRLDAGRDHTRSSKSYGRNHDMHAIALIVAAFGLVFTQPALAQSYPERNIQFVVPYPAGQTTDVLARVIADDFREIMKATVYVENKGGAGGILGMNFGKQAAPDGYTVLVTA